MTNGQLTATHLTATTDDGAVSTALQNYGRYYFEVTIGDTHGSSDCVGILGAHSDLHGLVSVGGTGSFAYYANGTVNGFNSITLTAYHPGDIISVAVDLISQTKTEGGLIWFRRNAELWNGDAGADPAKAAGGLLLDGFNYQRFWAPAVGFGGGGASVGDNVTANFGQSAFVRKPPNGFAIWSAFYDGSVKVLSPLTILDGEALTTPRIELANRDLRPANQVFDADTVFPARSTGGILPLFVNTLVVDDDAFYSPGYLATFNGVPAPTVTVSNGNLTATLNADFPNYVGARSLAQKNTGKYYFEMTVGQRQGNCFVGVLMEGATYTDMANQHIHCSIVQVSQFNSGFVYSNDTIPATQAGVFVPGDVVGVALNLDTRRVWFRRNSALWNGVSGHDPALGLGGYAVQPIVTFAPAVAFQGGTGTVGDLFTANFGNSTFANAMPTGFTPWPGGSLTQVATVTTTVPNDDVIAPLRVSPVNLFAAFVSDPTENVFLLSGTGGSPTLGANTFFGDATTTEAIYAPAVVAVAVTFDPTTRENVTLSGGNLIATHSNTVNNAGALAPRASLKTTGKFYFEVTFNSVHGDLDCCGLMTSIGTFFNLVTSGSNCLAVYRWNGAINSNGSNSGKTLGACTSGDIISIAVDLTARKAWLRKNGGNWNGLALGSENPNTGLGGVVLYPTVSFVPVVGFGGANTAAGDNMTANFAGPFLYAIPASFGTWGSASPVLMTLDGPPSADVTVTNGGLTAVHTSAPSANSGVRSLPYKNFGKYYYEATIGTMGAGVNGQVGVIMSTAPNYGYMIVFRSNTSSVNLTSGAVYSNSGYSGKILPPTPPMLVGDVVATATDLDARLCWFRRKSGASVSLWNNDPTADPATGVGGLAMENAPCTPAIVFDTGAAGDSVNANLGQTAYAMAKPSGFDNWTS